MSRLAVFFLMIVAPALAILLALLGLETLRANLLGWFLLLFGIAFAAGGLIYYFIRREPFWKSIEGGKTAAEEKGDRSFWLILPGFLAVFFAPPVELMYWHVLPNPLWIQITGLALILTALALRLWARAHIRGLYSGHVEVQERTQASPNRAVPFRPPSRIHGLFIDGTWIGCGLFQFDRTGCHPAFASTGAGLPDKGGGAPAGSEVRRGV